jgi:hypothetical protein
MTQRQAGGRRRCPLLDVLGDGLQDRLPVRLIAPCSRFGHVAGGFGLDGFMGWQRRPGRGAVPL